MAAATLGSTHRNGSYLVAHCLACNNATDMDMPSLIAKLGVKSLPSVTPPKIRATH